MTTSAIASEPESAHTRRWRKKSVKGDTGRWVSLGDPRAAEMLERIYGARLTRPDKTDIGNA